MKLSMFIFASLVSLVSQAQSGSWFIGRHIVVNCESYSKDGKSVIKKLEVRGKNVSFHDFEKDETINFVGQIQQVSSLKIWKDSKYRLSIGLRPSSWGQFTGSAYHLGVLEIKVDAQKTRDITLFCYPQAPTEQ